MFTLAHLSDAHLGPLPPVPIRALANKRMTGFLNWQRKRRFIHDPALLERIVADLKAARPDHIAATGDFANIGLPAEFAHARQWLSGLGEPRDVTAVPGNHDAYVRGSLEAMQATLADYMRGDGGDHGFPFVRRRDGVALIGLSTGIPTPPFMATGALGASQLDRFAAALDQNGNEGLFRVVLIHHPPISKGPAHKRLIDAVPFLSVIAEHGAELIIHGHDHEHAFHWTSGPDGTSVPIVGISSASAILRPGKDGAAYNLFRIDGKPGAWSCEMETRGLAPDGTIKTLKERSLR